MIRHKLALLLIVVYRDLQNFSKICGSRDNYDLNSCNIWIRPFEYTDQDQNKLM